MDLIEIVCAGLCRYYKPEKEEEVGCGGLEWLKPRPQWLEHLALLSPDEADQLFGLAEDDPRLLAICQTCEFRIDGCDFRDPEVSSDECSPCGGLRALAGLLAVGHDLGDLA